MKVLDVLKERGITCDVVIAPILPCDPKNLAGMLAGKVDYVSIMTCKNDNVQCKGGLLRLEAKRIKETFGLLPYFTENFHNFVKSTMVQEGLNNNFKVGFGKIGFMKFQINQNNMRTSSNYPVSVRVHKILTNKFL